MIWSGGRPRRPAPGGKRQTGFRSEFRAIPTGGPRARSRGPAPVAGRSGRRDVGRDGGGGRVDPVAARLLPRGILAGVVAGRGDVAGRQPPLVVQVFEGAAPAVVDELA